jgi:hypothetical protein
MNSHLHLAKRITPGKILILFSAINFLENKNLDFYFVKQLFIKAKMQKDPLGYWSVANSPPGVSISHYDHLGFMD